MRALLHNATAFLSLVMFTTTVANAQSLNDWVQKGPASNGNWVVAADGQSVTQSLRADDTINFFVSDKVYSDVELRYQIAVQTTRDDDYIGFVLGFNGPTTDAEADSVDCDFILLDWKQTFQNFGGLIAEAGLALSTFNGRFSSTSAGNGGDWPFWTHETEAGYDTLATAYGDMLGWEDNVVYDVTINYTPSRITVDVQGGMGAFQNEQRVLDVSGAFEPGNVGFYTYSQEGVQFTVEDITAVSVEDPNLSIPAGLRLYQNFPNPFNDRTTLTYTLSNATDVKLRVFNTLGQQVAYLTEGRYAPGTYTAEWDASGLPSGIYMVVLETSRTSITKNVLLLK